MSLERFLIFIFIIIAGWEQAVKWQSLRYLLSVLILPFDVNCIFSLRTENFEDVVGVAISVDCEPKVVDPHKKMEPIEQTLNYRKK